MRVPTSTYRLQITEDFDLLEAARTLPLGMSNITIVSQYRSDWGMAFAGLVLMMLPTLVVYIALQKHLTKGITAGAVKG